MNPQEVITFIGLVLGVLALLGGSLALVRGSYNRARIQGLREDNEDLRARLDDCDKEALKADARVLTQKEKISALERENEALKDMVTQRANVDQVVVQLNEHHEKAMSGQRELLELFMQSQTNLTETLATLVQGQERLIMTLERSHPSE